DRIAGHFVAPAKRKNLALDIWPRDAPSAVGRKTPSSNQRVDGMATSYGIALAHQHNQSASFSRKETGWPRVEDAHVLSCQRPQPGEADQFERVEAQIHPACERHVKFTILQRGAGVCHGY